MLPEHEVGCCTIVDSFSFYLHPWSRTESVRGGVKICRGVEHFLQSIFRPSATNTLLLSYTLLTSSLIVCMCTFTSKSQIIRYNSIFLPANYFCSFIFRLITFTFNNLIYFLERYWLSLVRAVSCTINYPGRHTVSYISIQLRSSITDYQTYILVTALI